MNPMNNNNEMIVIAALYQFVELPDYQELRDPLLKLCQQHGIKGTLLLAREGINGTVAGRRDAINALQAFLKADGRLNNLEYKESFAHKQPFLRMKVRLKKEIVTIGLSEVNPLKQVGTYVTPQEWNALLSDPEVIVIDTRNDYEVRIGAFKGALNPSIQRFREFPTWVQQNLAEQKKRKIAMYCTGGIRCEKASSYMLAAGFEEVYHLKGGILRYLETMPQEDSLWEGECFVFDHRVAVTHGLKVGSYDQCYGCRMPLSAADKQLPDYQEGVACGYCAHLKTEEDRRRYRERHQQIQLAKKRQQHHLGCSV